MGYTKKKYLEQLIKENDDYRATVCISCPESCRACSITDTEVDECVKSKTKELS